jgi:hypothetical protein
MKPKWLRVWKTFRGGVSKPDYIMLHPDDDERESARNWADRTVGGSNYGWTVHWKPVDMPPIEWIDKKIEGLERQIKAVDSNIKTYKKEKEEILKKIEVNQTKIETTIIEKDKMMDDIMEFIRRES